MGYYEFAAILAKSPNISCILVSPVPETHMVTTVTGDVGVVAGEDFMTKENSFPKLMAKLVQETEKPVICTIESGWKFEPLRKYLAE